MGRIRIGVFDSGIGGLSIYRELKEQLPAADYLYFADQANFPYGIKTQSQIYQLAYRAVGRMIDWGCELIVIGCNTVTVAAINKLRKDFPKIKFVGVVPPVKVAAGRTRSDRIIVLATKATCASPCLDELIARWCQGKRVTKISCSELVTQIEKEDLIGIKKVIKEKVLPIVRETGSDMVVSGCTHYPLVRETIEEIIFPAQFIEPSQAVAKQVKRLVGKTQGKGVGRTKIITTASRKTTRDRFEGLVQRKFKTLE